MAQQTNNAAGQNWFIKYKLYHIPFWVLYNYMWWLVQSRDFLGVLHEAFYSPYSLKFSCYVIVQAAVAYFSLYVLMPRFLEKGRYAVFLISVVASVLVGATLITFGYLFGAWVTGHTFQELYGHEFNFFGMLTGNPLPGTVASTTLAMSIKLTKNWVQSKRRQQSLEKEKLETELKFLKYQFNPHFLFNSINSIFFLIHKNPDVASASLAKFSDLLRHQLYECNDNQVPLENEITYLQNFIELEKLRQNKNVQVTFLINNKESNHLLVAPFILMTFVENAFKHVSHHVDSPNTIHIQIDVKGLTLLLTVVNTSAAPGTYKDVIHYGGIGLQNVRRRLDLIYGDSYKLDIQSTTQKFEVTLSLQLEQNNAKQGRHTEKAYAYAAV